MSRVKLAIFDLDQTLLDTLPRFYEVFNRVLEEAGGARVDWELFLEMYKRDELNELLPSGVGAEDFWRRFLELYDEHDPSSDRVLPGAEQALAELKRRGTKIVVVTGRRSRPEVVLDNLARHGLDKYVDAVYTATCAEELEFMFSKKEMILKALEDFGASPSETIFVGDYRYDMLSGKRAGVLTIGVTTGYESESVLRQYGADRVVNALCEILEAIRDG